MRLLLLSHAFNSLTQRLFVELRDRGHEVSVEFDVNDAVTREAVALFAPDLIIAPFLKRAIPDDIWRRHTCLIVHPGVRGDRGPSALDWAILNREASKDDIRGAMLDYAQRSMKGILDVTDEPLVSTDLRGTTYSSVFSSLDTLVVGNLVKVVAWYDNEWGYACRIADITSTVAGRR